MKKVKDRENKETVKDLDFGSKKSEKKVKETGKHGETKKKGQVEKG